MDYATSLHATSLHATSLHATSLHATSLCTTCGWAKSCENGCRGISINTNCEMITRDVVKDVVRDVVKDVVRDHVSTRQPPEKLNWEIMDAYLDCDFDASASECWCFICQNGLPIDQDFHDQKCWCKECKGVQTRFLK